MMKAQQSVAPKPLIPTEKPRPTKREEFPEKGKGPSWATESFAIAPRKEESSKHWDQDSDDE